MLRYNKLTGKKLAHYQRRDIGMHACSRRPPRGQRDSSAIFSGEVPRMLARDQAVQGASRSGANAHRKTATRACHDT